jgi:hypothetical protein
MKPLTYWDAKRAPWLQKLPAKILWELDILFTKGVFLPRRHWAAFHRKGWGSLIASGPNRYRVFRAKDLLTCLRGALWGIPQVLRLLPTVERRPEYIELKARQMRFLRG